MNFLSYQSQHWDFSVSTNTSTSASATGHQLQCQHQHINFRVSIRTSTSASAIGHQLQRQQQHINFSVSTNTSGSALQRPEVSPHLVIVVVQQGSHLLYREAGGEREVSAISVCPSLYLGESSLFLICSGVIVLLSFTMAAVAADRLLGC